MQAPENDSGYRSLVTTMVMPLKWCPLALVHDLLLLVSQDESLWTFPFSSSREGAYCFNATESVVQTASFFSHLDKLLKYIAILIVCNPPWLAGGGRTRNPRRMMNVLELGINELQTVGYM